jgi:hypothetical protein
MFKPIEVDLLTLMDMLEDTYKDTGVRWSALRELLEIQKAAQQEHNKETCKCGDHAFINEDTPGMCGNCGKPFHHNVVRYAAKG